MNKTKHHIKLLFLLIWCFSFSQNHTNYTIKDGLPSNHIYTIRQDVNGFIWFLTDKGVVKYNGLEFKKFTTKEGLPNNDVWEAFTTPDSKFWYLSKASRLGYIYNDTVLSFPNEVSNEIMNPIMSSVVKNKVYPTGPIKIHQLINGEWKVINNKRGNVKIFNKDIKSLELNSLNKTLSVIGKDASVKATFKAKDFINNSIKRGQITDSLFYFITNKSYHILNLNTLKLENRTFKNQLNKDTIKHVRINKVHDVLQISGEGFVGCLDANFNIEAPFFFPDMFNAHFGLIDKSKTVWCATFNNGVYKIPFNKKDASYSFLGKKVQSLDVVENKLFASIYNEGFFEYNTKNKNFNLTLDLKGYKYRTQYIETLVATCFLSHGNVYSIVKGKPFLQYDYTKANSKNKDKARKLVFHNNALYGMFTFGINKLNNTTLDVEHEFYQKGTNDVLSFNNQLLIATTNGLKELKKGVIVSKSYNNELLNTSILSLNKLSGNEFLINTDGFGSYIATNSKLKLIEGTEFLSVQNAFVEENTLWLATNKGVLRYKKQGDVFTLIATLNTNHGLPINKVNAIAVLGNKLFVATDNGLVSIPKNAEYKSSFLDVTIDKVVYNSKLISPTSVVSYTSDNNLNIFVSTIDFSDNNKNHSFKYKLLPIQKDWNKASIKTINYNNLQPKPYEFFISKNGMEKSFLFEIKPLWWQTLGFKVSFGFMGSVLVLSGVWLLSKRIQKRKDLKLIQEKQLSEIQLKALRSQMNPHFVFNSLSAIQFYINENNFEASEDFLIKFSRLIRQFFDLSKENEITISEEIKLLKGYLEIEKLRFKEKLDFKINVDNAIAIKSTKIPTMLLQPIVENAVNHGVFNKVENGCVVVDFKKEDTKTLVVEIIDDGVGFANTKSNIKKHNSSNVISDRLKYLNLTRNWSITFKNIPLNSKLKNKGNRAIFKITNLH